MKNLKFLLLGLIFALVCSVTFAGPPGTIPLTTNIEKKEIVTIDHAVLPAITIENSSLLDLRQHRAESSLSYNYINFYDVNQGDLAILNNPCNYSPRTYGINKSNIYEESRNKALEDQYYLLNSNITPPDPACNKRE